ncbi:MAG: succinylglutamate desuccinylase [Alphaproteobacteria bacterium]|nr:succinylglutamate desuccinylase [Alphaproteobacteria bacterium]
MPAQDHPVELTAPDISAYKAGNTGIDYVTTMDSGKPGPHVMINAVTHGNEICGAIALDHLFRNGIEPTRGRLTFAFVNHAAFHRFDPKAPRVSRLVDEDINRVWVEDRLDGDEDNTELRRARELRPIYDTVDHLLDIHSMGTLSPALMLCNGLDKEVKIARQIGYPGHIVCGSGHVRGKRLIEYTPFNDTANQKTALLVECGYHWARDTAPIALDTALHFLRAVDFVDQDFFAAHIRDADPVPQRVLEVTGGLVTETDEFQFVEDFAGLEAFPKAGSVIAIDGGKEITTPHDDCILVMPNPHARKGMRVLRFSRDVTPS